jgi:hypothetical protein
MLTGLSPDVMYVWQILKLSTEIEEVLRAMMMPAAGQRLDWSYNSEGYSYFELKFKVDN